MLHALDQEVLLVIIEDSSVLGAVNDVLRVERGRKDFASVGSWRLSLVVTIEWKACRTQDKGENAQAPNINSCR